MIIFPQVEDILTVSIMFGAGSQLVEGTDFVVVFGIFFVKKYIFQKMEKTQTLKMREDARWSIAKAGRSQV